MTRSDARASLTYSREAVVDNHADLLAPAVGERGVHRNPAHEQLNDLPALGVREVRLQALTDLRERIRRDGIVKRVISQVLGPASRSSRVFSSRSTSAAMASNSSSESLARV